MLLLFAGVAHAQDYAREERWRAEVLANLVVGDALRIASPSGHAFLGIYKDGKPDKPAVLLVHGLGVHPDHGVIGILRVALSDMGYATLSIQMPVLASDAPAEDYYPALFPDASQRIAAAAEWLKRSGARRIVLVSHGLGAWMSQHYLEQTRSPPFAGWVAMGRSGPIPALPLPVLDVHGEKDNLAVLESAPGRKAAKQVMIRGADHFYIGREEELARVLREFIDRL